VIVVSDTSPINYLLLIQHIDILPQLFGRIVLPLEVRNELLSKGSPKLVQVWAKSLPSWCVALPVSDRPDPALDDLDAGERAAILLAVERNADYLLIDELLGRQAASVRQLRVLGLLGVLRRADQCGLLKFQDAISKLQGTNFRMSSQLLATFLAGGPTT
jgi:predicted nucleic acid-binding protein